MIRRLFRDLVDGLRNGIDVLLWGQAYPAVREVARDLAAIAAAAESPGRTRPGEEP